MMTMINGMAAIKKLLLSVALVFSCVFLGCSGWTTDNAVGCATSGTGNSSYAKVLLDTVSYKFSMDFEKIPVADTLPYGTMRFILGSNRIHVMDKHFEWMDYVFSSDTVEITYNGDGSVLLMTYEDENHKPVEMIRSLRSDRSCDEETDECVSFFRDECEVFVNGSRDKSQKCSIYWLFDEEAGKAVISWD